MKAIEFMSEMSEARTLTIPLEVAEQVPAGRTFRVLFLLDDPTEDEDWARLTAEQFAKGYADSDAIYDNY